MRDEVRLLRAVGMVLLGMLLYELGRVEALQSSGELHDRAISVYSGASAIFTAVQDEIAANAKYY
jgi:hypothetical protein